MFSQLVSFDLGGEADVTYPLRRLIARFDIPSRHVMDEAAPAETGKPKLEDVMTNTQSTALVGTRVLLVEDQVLIAMDAEDYLRAHGAAHVAIASTAAAALRQIEAERPDVAVLDVNLGDHTSAPVAEHLASLGVPFVFATGYGDSATAPETMHGVAVVRKPYTENVLIAALNKALASKAKG